ncbi:ester cyclase [Methylorubrum suomiense]|uniref:Aklanonic acid methyl ester cyclase DnrD n=1 Tax=Methylorubrum suomiense TaxID=144191 RepID=A0ABQ4USH8_9HYPH|nr:MULTISPECIES: ester cyclase [Methylobacteriaceae]GJE75288.1 Aklanonic acid methyl ester cyclase DnrD [Methylorubrum suomiense]
MSTEANKDLVRAYFTAFRDRDAAWWQRFIASDFVRHDPGLDFEVRGPDGVARLGEVLHGAFSDIEMHIAEVIAEGDRVLARLRFTGRHTGEFEGTPATGNGVDIAVMDYFRVANGQLVEHWALMDNLGMLRQIGAVEA